MMEIIGGSGFVGKVLVENTTIKEIKTPTHREMDITNPDSVKRYLQNSPARVVVNLAAFTNVKLANLEPEQANLLNINGPENLAKACKKTDKMLIHISTDGVFPITNDHKGPHPEGELPIDDPDFVSAYGLSKLRGEKRLLEVGGRTAILRIAYPFGNAELPEKDYILKLLETVKKGYGLFEDQYLSSTYLLSLVSVVDALAEQELTGIFHWVCRGLFTPFEMASFINKRFNLNLEIKRGSLVDLVATKGKQPYAQYGGLSTKLTEERLKLTPPTWQEATVEFLSKSGAYPNIPNI